MIDPNEKLRDALDTAEREETRETIREAMQAVDVWREHLEDPPEAFPALDETEDPEKGKTAIFNPADTRQAIAIDSRFVLNAEEER